MAYDPHREKRPRILEYFERNPRFQGLGPLLQEFWRRPDHRGAVALLTFFFQRHEQGDVESLRHVTSVFADKRLIRSLVGSLLNDDDALKRVAAASYSHPIGFDKLVLFHHRPPGREHEGFKFRLHLYWRSPQDLGHELVHLHRFEMASAPITGELSNDLMRIVQFTDETSVAGSMKVHDDEGGERQEVFAYTGYQRDPDGSLHKRYMGPAVLERIGRQTFLPGDTYSQILEHAHYVETNAETGHCNGDFCSTVYIHGPNLADDQGRTLPVLFEDIRLPDDEQEIRPIPHLKADSLKSSLQRYADLLDESISFYDWLYDPRYGRDLSVGMLAGYLLSEHLKSADTLELWQRRYPECKQVMEHCSARLKSLIEGLESGEEPAWDEDDRTTRYYKMMLAKALDHRQGPAAWLQLNGDLKKELWRYFGALIGDYARNPDLRTLKPIWEENFRQTYGDLAAQNLQGGAHYGHISAMLEAAFVASEIIMGYFRQGLRGDDKGDGGGPVTRADLEAQVAIRRILKEHFPSYVFIGEERECDERTEETTSAVEGARRFLVDPLDGTSNFVNGHKDFTVSIACQQFQDGCWQSLDGVVALPAHHEVFWAERGRGAFLIDDRGHESRLGVCPPVEEGSGKGNIVKGKALSVSLAGLGPEGFGVMLSGLAQDRARLRANGSVALMAAQVSGCGAHAMLATAAEYDVAAGRLIAEEAGAVQTARRFERQIEMNGVERTQEFELFLIAHSRALLTALEERVDSILSTFCSPPARA